jgi:hypothetical protein
MQEFEPEAKNDLWLASWLKMPQHRGQEPNWIVKRAKNGHFCKSSAMQLLSIPKNASLREY